VAYEHVAEAAHGGAFADEDGAAWLQVGGLARHADPAKLSVMRAINRALDPACLIDPGAVLRET